MVSPQYIFLGVYSLAVLSNLIHLIISESMMNSGSLALKFLVVIFSQTVKKKKKTDSDFFSLWGQFPTSFISLSVLRTYSREVSSVPTLEHLLIAT